MWPSAQWHSIQLTSFSVLNIPVQVSFEWQDDSGMDHGTSQKQRDVYNQFDERDIITLDNINTMYSTPRSTSYSQFEAFVTSKRGNVK